MEQRRNSEPLDRYNTPHDRWGLNRRELEQDEGKDKKNELYGKTKKDAPKDEKKAKETEPPKKERAEEKQVKDKGEVEEVEVKQEKRAEIIERSHAYKKQFEDEPIPRDPETLARLIVAEHVLAIEEKLHSPEKDDHYNEQELEETLDYLCLLAEKFEDPEVESLPEIDEAYENLIELAEEALAYEQTPEFVVEQAVVMLDHDLNPAQQADMREQVTVETTELQGTEQPASMTHPLPMVLLAKVVARFRKSEIKASHTVPQFSGSGSAPSIKTNETLAATMPRMETPQTPVRSPDYSVAHGRQHDTYDAFPFERVAPHDAREYHLAPQYQRPIHPLATIALAAIVARGIDRSPTSPVSTTPQEFTRPVTRQEAPLSVASRPVATRQETRQPVFSEVLTPQTETSHPHPEKPTTFRAAPHEVQTVTAASSRKLEHMPLLTLLTMAHGIHIGHGQYLKEEFERGKIDKDGLVKVLKARAKGLDYTREYQKQVTHYRELKRSPEFLREDRQQRSVTPVDIDDTRQDTPPAQDNSSQKTSEQPSLPKPIISSPSAQPSASEATSKTQESSVGLWIAAIIIGLIILGILVWTLTK